MKRQAHVAHSIQRYNDRITKTETTHLSETKKHEARSKNGMPTVSEIQICGCWRVILNLKTGSMRKTARFVGTKWGKIYLKLRVC